MKLSVTQLRTLKWCVDRAEETVGGMHPASVQDAWTVIEEARATLKQLRKDSIRQKIEQSSPSPSVASLEYTVIEHPNAEALGVHVNNLIKLGWIPQGGVAVTQVATWVEKVHDQAVQAREFTWTYSQALTRVISGQK